MTQAIDPIICRCGHTATIGREVVYGWHWAGCGKCGIYVSANTPEEVGERYRHRLAHPLPSDPQDIPWWEMGEE